MAEQDDLRETDGAAAVPDEHEGRRRRFVELWHLRTAGDAGVLALDAAWQPIADLPDSHISVDAAAAHQDLPQPDSAEIASKRRFA